MPDVYDLVVYGATVAGVAATIAGARAGKKILLIQTGSHFGGMTTGGLCHTDKGDESTIGGIAFEFYSRVGQAYGRSVAWSFEPSVAERVLRSMLGEATSGHVDVVSGQLLDTQDGVQRPGRRIERIVMESGQSYTGRVFLDCSYEGDLMAKASVCHTIGRESRATYNEPLAGVTSPGKPVQRKQFFPRQVSPYRPDGQLLAGISDEPLGNPGDGDEKVQAYCFRLCVTDCPSRRVPFDKPEAFDPDTYELLARWIVHTPDVAVSDWRRFYRELLPGRPLPGGKSEVNDGNPASTDYIGANAEYPGGDRRTRDRIWREHVAYTKGYLWFIANDPRVPEPLRRDASRYGYDASEFAATGHFPPQMYVRESRRMIGATVITQHDCRDNPRKDDSIGVYPVDCHHVRRIVVDGRVVNEGNFNNQSWGIYPHEIPYRAITPDRDSCGNLLVPVCLSCSHVAWSSIRMEPVFMILGQSAATAAVMAVEADIDVQQVDIRDLQRRLVASGQILDRGAARSLMTARRTASGDTAQ
jgi:hypothetical protein